MKNNKNNLNNLEIFALMNLLLVSTMLSNCLNDEFLKDYKKIEKFNNQSIIGKDIASKNTLEFKTLRELSTISTFKDTIAYRFNVDDSEKNLLLDAKCRALEKIQNIYENVRSDQYVMNYEYLRDYYPEMRFKELSNSIFSNNIEVNKVIAICLALGIGCNQNLELSIYKFKENAYSGDIASMYYLRNIYKELKDEENFTLYDNLISLADYLIAGKIDLPISIKGKFSSETIKTYSLISMIRLKVQERDGYLNKELMEVVLSENQKYNEVVNFVTKYESGIYKDALMGLIATQTSMGFKGYE